MLPNSLANLEKGRDTQFKPGQSGNPGGLPGTDLAALYAGRFFEQHSEGISKQMAEDLKGFNAYGFGVLADRGYGKVREHQRIEHTGTDPGPVNLIVQLVKANHGKPCD